MKEGGQGMENVVGASNSNIRNHEQGKGGSRGGAEARSDLDDITGAIVDCSVKLHQALGPGLLESVYEAVLARDLVRRGLSVERQKVIRFEYDGMEFEEGLRIDLLVEGCVVVELKSVEQLAAVYKKQVLTYLRLMKLPVGLLLNFGAPVMKEGLYRIVNNLDPSAPPRESGAGCRGLTRRRGGAERNMKETRY